MAQVHGSPPFFSARSSKRTVRLINLAALIGRAGATPARLAPLALAALLVAGFAVHQHRLTTRSLRFGNFKNDDGIDTPAYLRVYAHDRGLIGQRLRPCVRPDDFAI